MSASGLKKKDAQKSLYREQRLCYLLYQTFIRHEGALQERPFPVATTYEDFTAYQEISLPT